jgi:hypothetical protein
MARSEILNRFLSGTVAKRMRLAAARGLAPLPRNELLEVLVHLSGDAEEDVRATAANSLREWPEPEVVEELGQASCAPSVLEYFASSKPQHEVLEAVVRNPSSPPTLIARIAETAPAPLLDLILDNRVRILEAPSILSSIKRNPETTPQIGRLVLEIEAEFVNSRKSEYRIEETAVEAPPEPAEAQPLPEITADDLALEGLPVDPDAREVAILQRLASMTIRQKIQCALFGDREMRSILVRSTNQEISRSVMKNPKLSDNEVEGFAAMRNVSEEILRQIATSREWTRSYTVVSNLVKNPKTPAGLAQRLLFRLQSKDLTLLTRDRGVGEVVRRHAKRVLQQRTAPGQPSG